MEFYDSMKACLIDSNKRVEALKSCGYAPVIEQPKVTVSTPPPLPLRKSQTPSTSQLSTSQYSSPNDAEVSIEAAGHERTIVYDQKNPYEKSVTEIKPDKSAAIHTGIGKLSFGDEQLCDNLREFIVGFPRDF